MLNSLKTLDLAGATIPQEACKVLWEDTPAALELVSVRFAIIDERILLQLSKQRPSLKLELDEGMLSPDAIDFLLKTQQLIVASDFDDMPIRAYESLPPLLQNEKRTVDRGDIDPRRFAPAPNETF